MCHSLFSHKYSYIRIFRLHGVATLDRSGVGDGDAEPSPPILITGAMRPERFTDSDAAFNVGMAVAAVQTVARGWIGVCMHGAHDRR